MQRKAKTFFVGNDGQAKNTGNGIGAEGAGKEIEGAVGFIEMT